jgi:hypothetical protein
MDISEQNLISLTSEPVVKLQTSYSSIVLEHPQVDKHNQAVQFSMFENTLSGS